jgi:hypothetical protein
MSTLNFEDLLRPQLRVLPVAHKRMILLDQGAPSTLPFQAVQRPVAKSCTDDVKLAIVLI